MTKPKVWLHGECALIQASLPVGATPVSMPMIAAENAAIIAPSEVTGNHHVIDMEPGVEFFSHEGKNYANSKNPMTVRCVLKERHDAVTLPPGTYLLGFQQEFNYLEMVLQQVRD